VRWDPNKKPPGTILFLLTGGWSYTLFHYPVLLLIFNYHNQESNCAQPKKIGSATPILCFSLFGGVLVIGRRDYLGCHCHHNDSLDLYHMLIINISVQQILSPNDLEILDVGSSNSFHRSNCPSILPHSSSWLEERSNCFRCILGSWEAKEKAPLGPSWFQLRSRCLMPGCRRSGVRHASFSPVSDARFLDFLICILYLYIYIIILYNLEGWSWFLIHWILKICLCDILRRHCWSLGCWSQS